MYLKSEIGLDWSIMDLYSDFCRRYWIEYNHSWPVFSIYVLENEIGLDWSIMDLYLDFCRRYWIGYNHYWPVYLCTWKWDWTGLIHNGPFVKVSVVLDLGAKGPDLTKYGQKELPVPIHCKLISAGFVSKILCY